MKLKTLAVFCFLGLVSSLLADDKSVITLLAKDAKLKGEIEYHTDHLNLGKWDGVGSSATWIVKGIDPGPYKVQITYALKGDTAGRKFSIASGSDSSTIDSLDGTGGWFTFVTKEVGTINLTAEETFFAIKAKAIPKGGSLMNLTSVTLQKSK